MLRHFRGNLAPRLAFLHFGTQGEQYCRAARIHAPTSKPAREIAARTGTIE
jgi:hypothetical protein